MEILLQQAQQIKAAVEAMEKVIHQEYEQKRTRFRKEEKNSNTRKSKCRRR
jgi:hypothetical protein